MSSQEHLSNEDTLMNGQRESCCGAVDETTPEIAQETMAVANDGRTAAPTVARDGRLRPRMLQRIRRRFGISERTPRS